jgi:Kef-type K+ transport system membrane component KefB
MSDQVDHLWLLAALVGAIIVLSVIIRRGFEALGLPALVGYLLLGMLLAGINNGAPFLGTGARHVIEFLGSIGVFCLLFRVGLDSKIGELVAQLGRAIRIWIGNVAISGGIGYLAARYILDYALVPSLFVAVALTATSLAVCLGTWREVDALKTRSGSLLIDVAELDDVSGIAFMILLFGIAPALVGGDGPLLPLIGETLLAIIVKAALFMAACVLFARYLERPMTAFFERIEPAPDPMLPVVGVGVMIAAAADGLGFSIPVGALFAGLVFSRDPEAVKVNASFTSLYDLFTPFFFVWIGLSLDPGSMTVVGAVAAAVIFAAAATGKVVGTMLPAWPLIGAGSALLIGVSMVPRAEIAMVIVAEGRRLGDWAMPLSLYEAVVLASAATCVVAPVITRIMLRRAPPPGSGSA